MNEYPTTHYSHQLGWRHWSQIENINKQRIEKNILYDPTTHLKTVYQFAQDKSYYTLLIKLKK